METLEKIIEQVQSTTETNGHSNGHAPLPSEYATAEEIKHALDMTARAAESLIYEEAAEVAA